MSGIYRDKGEQAMEEERREKARRLSRYDEAVLLLQLALAELYRPENQATFNRVDAFLAAEPKEGEGGR